MHLNMHIAGGIGMWLLLSAAQLASQGQIFWAILEGVIGAINLAQAIAVAKENNK